MNPRRPVVLCLACLLASLVAPCSYAQRAVMTNDQRLYKEARTESKVTGRATVAEEATVTGREGNLLQVTLSGDRSGWTLAAGVVVLENNSRAAALLFDAAQQMAREDAPEAWQAAARLYRKAASIETQGAYAPEAQFRAARLAWRTEVRETGGIKPDSSSINELNAVTSLFPKTRQAASAAYLVLRAHLCEFWDGTPGCPEAEASAIRRSLGDYPESPYAAELRYSLAYRHAALVEIYLQQGKQFFSPEKAVEHKNKARETVAELLRLNRDEPGWTARGERLVWCLDNNTGVFSNIEQPLRRF